MERKQIERLLTLMKKANGNTCRLVLHIGNSLLVFPRYYFPTKSDVEIPYFLKKMRTFLDKGYKIDYLGIFGIKEGINQACSLTWEEAYEVIKRVLNNEITKKLIKEI
jgi:hypothetical protein